MAYKLGTSYFSTRILSHVEKDLREIKRRHCTFVLHTFSENDLFYNLDNMRRITALSHKMGLEVYYSPWALGGVFGGEAFSRFVMKYPEACQVLSTGERVGNACLRHPLFRAYVKSWIEAAASAGGDVLFWDEPHLWIAAWNERPERKNEFSCRCKVCQAHFKRAYGKPYPRTRTREVDEFRDDTLIEFLSFATRTAKKVNPRLKNTVCLLPHDKRWPNPMWEGVASLKSVDIVATDPYWKARPWKTGKRWDFEKFVPKFAERIADLARRHRKEPQGWVQIFALARKEEADITKALSMWERSGVKNLAAWGFMGCESFSLLASERPRECWKRMGDYFKKLSKQD